MRASPLLAALSFLAVAFAGCATDPAPDPDPDGGEPTLVPVQDRHRLPFRVDEYHSHTLRPGTFGILPAQSVFVDVTLPPTSGGAAVIGGAGPLASPRVHLGLFLPDVPNGTKVPVIADVGPYYDDIDLPATSNETRRLGGFLIRNFVPHGYAVAQVSVFGTGESNHCMDLMGPDEQAGIDAALTWLGTQEWSNGKIGVIGRSYDGSTPWEAAAMGNAHMATMVPISGLVGQHELMWRNGTAETRGPIMHNGVYGFFGIDSVTPPVFGTGPSGPNDPDPEDVQTLCQGYLTGPLAGAGGYLTGSNLGDGGARYWRDRYFFDRALANWNGSVYFIHGLQDWNVDPHVAFPYYNQLREAGFEVKGLFGQWGHMYPDRPGEHKNLPAGEGAEAFPESVRYDWAQDLLEWFDHYLKGTGPKPALHTEVQANTGQWRIEPGAYPTPDAAYVAYGADAFEQTTPGQPVVQPHGGTADPGEDLAFAMREGLANTTHISGWVRLQVDATPLGSGGQLFATLIDLDAGAGEPTRLGHAVMDLRYAGGGTSMNPVVAGMPLVARMEFEVMDAIVPAGHRLGLELTATGRDYLPSANPAPVLVTGFTLNLPVLPEGHGIAFSPPAWSGQADSVPQDP